MEEVDIIPASYYQESRYVSRNEFDALEKISLDFEPFENEWIYFSEVSGRLYAGYIGMERHGNCFLIRPITYSALIESDLLAELYADWAYKMADNINCKANYSI